MSTVTELLKMRKMIDEMLEKAGAEVPVTSGAAAVTKKTKTKKREGVKPGWYADYTKQTLAAHAAEVAAFKLANPEVKDGPHIVWLAAYKKEHLAEV